MPLWSLRPLLQAELSTNLWHLSVFNLRLGANTFMERDKWDSGSAGKRHFIYSSDYAEVLSIFWKGANFGDERRRGLDHEATLACGGQLEHVCCHHESLSRATSNRLSLNLTQCCHCVLGRSGVLVESLIKPVFLKKCLGAPRSTVYARIRTGY